MDYSAPNSYKNFLPSKKLLFVILAIVVAVGLAIGIPKLITYVKNRKTTPPDQQAVSVTSVNGGDPTTRDSDGDGVPDWEEVLVGLDPHNPETTAGTPDATAFEKIKSQVGVDTFSQQQSQVDDTDKMSLTMYDDLSKDADQNGETTNGAVTNITQDEILNYVKAKKAANKTYAQADLNIVSNTDANIQKFYPQVKKITDSLDDPALTQHITDYMTGKESKDTYFTAKIAQFNTAVKSLLAIPVPNTAIPMYLESINAFYGMSQTLDAYDPTATDDALKQFGNVALMQDYLSSAEDAGQQLTIYFSVILGDPTKK